jgi:predicted nucleic-acid-binding Zn-ribbon protein
MGIWEGLKRATSSIVQGPGAASYLAGGRKLACPHCEGDRFTEGRTLMNTPGMSFANLDWANKRATTLMCERCGLVQWLGIEPQRLPEKSQVRDDWSEG